jgi:hypothetical protein
VEDDTMRVARAVFLNAEQGKSLEQQARGRSLPARVVERARIVLLTAEGLRDKVVLHGNTDCHSTGEGKSAISGPSSGVHHGVNIG